MPENDSPKLKRASKRSDPRALTKFLQELSWLLNSYSDLDFKALESLGTSVATPSLAPTKRQKSNNLPKKPNVHTLVGVLPGLLVDERLFPTNEDIAEFAEGTLGVSILRWQKKSKFELIGHIVCTANTLNDKAISSLVEALSQLTGEDRTRKIVEDQRQSGASWNEVIQGILAASR